MATMIIGAKPIDQLINTPLGIRELFRQWIEGMNNATEMYESITDTFNSPVLDASLSELVEAVTQHARAIERIHAAGYTTDDAIAFYYHQKEETA